MPFDDAKWRKPVTGGEMGAIALDVSVALSSIHLALAKLSMKAAVDINAELASVEKARADMWKAFEELTGWENVK